MFSINSSSIIFSGLIKFNSEVNTGLVPILVGNYKIRGFRQPSLISRSTGCFFFPRHERQTSPEPSLNSDAAAAAPEALQHAIRWLWVTSRSWMYYLNYIYIITYNSIDIHIYIYIITHTYMYILYTRTHKFHKSVYTVHTLLALGPAELFFRRWWREMFTFLFTHTQVWYMQERMYRYVQMYVYLLAAVTTWL